MIDDFSLQTTNSEEDLRNIIYTVRGIQVMLDSDLALLYKVDTRVFNQAVKRNIERFPDNFRFQLTADEYTALRSQFVISKENQLLCSPQTPPSLRSQSVISKENTETLFRHGGRRYLPYVFSEQGVAMLSSVLRSDFAIQTSIRIMNAFVEMRHVIASTASLFSRLESLEKRQIAAQYENDKKFELIFDALDRQPKPTHGIFFDGQIYDAYAFVNHLISRAVQEITLIDGYVDLSVLDMLSRKKNGVKVMIVTHPGNALSNLDIQKFNAQYPPLSIKYSKLFHDRFMILDQKELYHLGASLKDLGLRCFGFSKMDSSLIPAINSKF